MSEIQTLHQLITEALAEIRLMKEILEGKNDPEKGFKKLVDTDYIIKDLGISRASFEKKVKPKMPFLFKLKSNGKLYAKLNEYDEWKESLVKSFQTIRKEL